MEQIATHKDILDYLRNNENVIKLNPNDAIMRLDDVDIDAIELFLVYSYYPWGPNKRRGMLVGLFPKVDREDHYFYKKESCNDCWSHYPFYTEEMVSVLFKMLVNSVSEEEFYAD